MPREARYQRRHERRDRRRMRKLSTFLCGWLSRARVCGVVEIRDRVIRVVAGARGEMIRIGVDIAGSTSIIRIRVNRYVSCEN